MYISNITSAADFILDEVKERLEAMPDIEVTHTYPRRTEDQHGEDGIIFEIDVRWYDRAFCKAKGAKKDELARNLRSKIEAMIFAADNKITHPGFRFHLELCINNY